MSSELRGILVSSIGLLLPLTSQAQNTAGSQIEEVVVTAQKRVERLQDVPVPVAVVDTQRLTQSNTTRLQDYYMTVPGLTVTPAVNSTQVIAIRGITTGPFTIPTVGIVIDDVPFGTSKNGIIPDVDPGDVERIEVLRGPQGTLYGASSMGGLVKYTTKSPTFDRLGGELQLGTSQTSNGDGLGYSARGALNVPLADTFALNGSAFTRQEPGYIDNPVLGVDGLNELSSYGGRVALLWKPSDTVSLTLRALYQNDEEDGSSDTTELPGLGDLQQNYLAGVGGSEREIQAYSATLEAKLGSADLTILSGYNIQDTFGTFDFTYAFGGLSQALFGNPDTTVATANETKKFTQEVRLSMSLGDRVDWQVGAFYTDEDTQFIQDWLNVEAASGAQQFGLHAVVPSDFQEYAAFTTFTVKFGEQFDIQVGGRGGRIEQSVLQTETGAFVPILRGVLPPYVAEEQESEDDSFTYLLSPRFKLSPDVMVYARLASGYRAGGINNTITQNGGPPAYEPDETQNYELGLKGNFLDDRLYVEGSVYYIDWRDIQLGFTDPVTQQGYFDNGTRAESRGIELSVEARPLQGLSLGAWVTLQEAELAEDFPAGSSAAGGSGDRLPYSSRISGNVSIQQRFAMWGSATGFVGATVSYVGDRKGPFGTTGAPERQTLPSYTKADLRAGVQLDSWSGSLYVNNLTDERGLVAGGAGYVPPYGFLYIRPRTVGLSITKSF